MLSLGRKSCHLVKGTTKCCIDHSKKHSFWTMYCQQLYCEPIVCVWEIYVYKKIEKRDIERFRKKKEIETLREEKREIEGEKERLRELEETERLRNWEKEKERYPVMLKGYTQWCSVVFWSIEIDPRPPPCKAHALILWVLSLAPMELLNS